MDGVRDAAVGAKVGVDCPPLHPNCRSTTVADFDDMNMADFERRARDPATGELVTVSANTSYVDWKQHFYNEYGGGRLDAAIKVALNDAADKEQFARYQSVLGKKNVPGTFAEFKDLKYTDSMKYEHLKWEYRFDRQHIARDAAELLPNHQNAQGIQEKLLSYALNLNHESGMHKAVVFESALGYNASNAGVLERQIRRGLMRYRADYVGNKGFGDAYRMKMLVDGPKGRKVISIGWIFDTGSQNPRMVTVYVD